MRKRVTGSWFRYSAFCEECEWQLLDSKNGLGVAARHFDATGHHVNVDVVGGVGYYTPEDWERYKEKGLR